VTLFSTDWVRSRLGATRLMDPLLRGLALWNWIQSCLSLALCWVVARPAAPNLRPPRKILVLRPDEAGDLVMTLAFVTGLRKAFPKAEIWLGLKPSLKELFRDQGTLDGCLELNLPPRRIARFPIAPWKAWQEGRRWRSHGFDTCFMPRFGPDLHWAAWAAWAAGIPRREGFGNDNPERAAVDPGLERLLTRVWRSQPGPLHELERSYEALRQISPKAGRPLPRLALPGAEVQAARKRLRLQGWDGHRPLVLLGLDAGTMCRAWPVEKFYEMTKAFPGLDWVLQAAPDQAGLVEELGTRLQGPRLDAGFSLRKLAACAALCQAYVGSDSGPKHVALALGLPVVEISRIAMNGDPNHYTAPERFGPWLKSSKVLRPERPLPPCTGPCQAAGPHCISQIPASSAVDALKSLLRRRRAPKGKHL
jgi:ADP-heptose:LPS heptosyltransferase